MFRIHQTRATKHQIRATNHISHERKNPERFKPKRRNSKSQTYQSLKNTSQGQISFENQKMMRVDTIKKGQKTSSHSIKVFCSDLLDIFYFVFTYMNKEAIKDFFYAGVFSKESRRKIMHFF